MYAVFETGGKQYRASAGDTVTVERLGTEAGQSVTFDRVLLVSNDGQVTVGAPVVEKASVVADVVEHKRGPKLIAFKMKRRKGYRRKIGHRQELTVVKITDIQAGGKSAKAEKTKKADPAEKVKPAKKTAEKSAPKAEEKTAEPKPEKAEKADTPEKAEKAEEKVAEPKPEIVEKAKAKPAEPKPKKVEKADTPEKAEPAEAPPEEPAESKE